MILTAHQPSYLPWLGLFHKIALADEFVHLDQVQYQPGEFNNRNRIKTSRGPIWLSVPALKRNYLKRTIADIEIDNKVPWGRKHWRAIKQEYGKAPYFARYAGYFESLYSREWKTLVDLDESMLRWFLDTLGISVKWRRARDYKFRERKQDLIFEMCEKFGADTFLFGALGRDYADAEAFERAGIRVVFQDYQHPTYPQQYGEFVPNLSVVDLLFNCGDASLDILMSGNIGRESMLRFDSRAMGRSS